MDALHVIADDLTGACDVAAALLPWPGPVVVSPDGTAAVDGPARLVVRNTQSRTLPSAAAARRVREALDGARIRDGVVLKKIDTGLRGQLGAEIDAVMEAVGAQRAFVLPAIPEVGRTTVGGEQRIDGVPVHRTAFADDPHNPVRESRVASVIGLGRSGVPEVPLVAVRGAGGPAPRSTRRLRRSWCSTPRPTPISPRRCGRCCVSRGRCCWLAPPASRVRSAPRWRRPTCRPLPWTGPCGGWERWW